MITRSNLAEQLREYQLRSKHDWASVSFFSSTSNLSSSSRERDNSRYSWQAVSAVRMGFPKVSFSKIQPRQGQNRIKGTALMSASPTSWLRLEKSGHGHSG